MFLSSGLSRVSESVYRPRRVGAAAYVYVHDRPDAQTVLSQLSAWFEDYNEVHPHKALQLKSPREFIRSCLQPAACPVG